MCQNNDMLILVSVSGRVTRTHRRTEATGKRKDVSTISTNCMRQRAAYPSNTNENFTLFLEDLIVRPTSVISKLKALALFCQDAMMLPQSLDTSSGEQRRLCKVQSAPTLQNDVNADFSCVNHEHRANDTGDSVIPPHGPLQWCFRGAEISHPRASRLSFFHLGLGVRPSGSTVPANGG